MTEQPTHEHQVARMRARHAARAPWWLLGVVGLFLVLLGSSARRCS